jgi:hypothetical protein
VLKEDKVLKVLSVPKEDKVFKEDKVPKVM